MKVSWNNNYVPSMPMRAIAFLGAFLLVFGAQAPLFGPVRGSDIAMMVLGAALLVIRFVRLDIKFTKKEET